MSKPADAEAEPATSVKEFLQLPLLCVFSRTHPHRGGPPSVCHCRPRVRTPAYTLPKMRYALWEVSNVWEILQQAVQLLKCNRQRPTSSDNLTRMHSSRTLPIEHDPSFL